jgi:hypothetical protein
MNWKQISAIIPTPGISVYTRSRSKDITTFATNPRGIRRFSKEPVDRRNSMRHDPASVVSRFA